MKLPRIALGPKPRPWDYVAAAILLAGLAAAVMNWVAAQNKPPGTSLSGSFTTAIATVQLLVLTGGLMVLGKTAKEGTLWGNLAAVGGLMVGLGGFLLAAALWAAA